MDGVDERTGITVRDAEYRNFPFLSAGLLGVLAISAGLAIYRLATEGVQGGNSLPMQFLNYAAGFLLIFGSAFHVIEGGKIASVPPAEVREAYWRMAGAHPVFASIGPGFAGAVMGGAALEVRARAAASEARQGSGFYLEVRDFKKPLWRFQSEDEGVLRQINELVSQVFEGRVVSRGSRADEQ